MKRSIFILFIFAWLAAAAQELSDSVARQGSIIPMGESFLEMETPRDSILVADRLFYGFDLKQWPDSVKLIFPQINPQFMEEVLAIPAWKVDTLKIKNVKNSQQRFLDIRAAIALQPFSEGEYHLPPLCVLRDEGDGVLDTLVWRAAEMDVKTMPVDTASFTPHDLRGQMTYPLTVREVLPWIGGLFWCGLIVALIISWILSRKAPGENAGKPKDPAHIVALKKLDTYRGNKYWVPEKQKQFYSGVTDALREYIAARYGVGAMEMTTAEIFEGLKDSDIPKDLKDELQTLFERADFVKFAKFIATDEENATVLPQAVKFVTSTYQLDIETDNTELTE